MNNQTVSGIQDNIKNHWNRDAAEPATKGGKAVRSDKERQSWLAALRPLLPPPPAVALDIGTGRGIIAFLLADLGYSVTGIDLAEAMVDASIVLASGRVNAPVFRVGDALAPPVAPASFDVVSNRQVVWTLLDPEQAFRNWLTLLRPGGTLLSIHLRYMNRAGGGYSQEARDALPSLPHNPSSALVERGDPRYPDAVAELIERVGFVDLKLTEMPEADAYEKEIDSPKQGWVAITAVRPAVSTT